MSTKNSIPTHKRFPVMAALSAILALTIIMAAGTAMAGDIALFMVLAPAISSHAGWGVAIGATTGPA